MISDYKKNKKKNDIFDFLGEHEKWHKHESIYSVSDEILLLRNATVYPLAGN